MTYFLCSRDHYVQSHRGETLSVGDTCPARDCGSKLRPAPDAEESVKCPGCNKGLLIPTELDGVNVGLCSFCGQSRLARQGEVNVPAAKSGAQRVAEHRARKRGASRG